jgi:hypothetical protein
LISPILPFADRLSGGGLLSKDRFWHAGSRSGGVPGFQPISAADWRTPVKAKSPDAVPPDIRQTSHRRGEAQFNLPVLSSR